VTSPSSARPRQVTFGGTQAIVGGALSTVLLIATAQQLYEQPMTEALEQALADPRAAGLDITVETARTIAKYTIMVMGVLSVASLVLGVFVLRRHRPARVALTILGVLVALATLLAGPPGWAVSVYVAASVVMLWSKPARAWFSDSEPSAFTSPPASFPPPPPPR